MLLSKNVVYGKDLNHYQDEYSGGFRFHNSTWANVSVYAILKKQSGVMIPSTIQIRRIEPRSTCSGTDNLQPGKEYIFMIQSAETNRSDVFDLDEVNAHQTAAVDADDDVLYEAVKTCSLNDVRPPDGDQPPVDPETQAMKLQEVASHAANNATCKIVKVLGSPYGSGGAGAQTGSDVIHKAAIAILNFLTVAAFTLLL